jgi:DNA-binding NtrC family response regulator
MARGEGESQLNQGFTYIRAARAPLPPSFASGGELIATHTTDVPRTGWIMFIGPDDDDRPKLVDALESLGLTFAVADDFQEAKRVLATQPPDLLITHVRLGAYNGLQLVLRGKLTCPTMAAIVVADAADPVLEREARAMDATLVLKTANRAEWIAAAQRVIPRKEPGE